MQPSFSNSLKSIPLTFYQINLPAHCPYFFRLILEIPQGARKKARNIPTTVTTSLHIHQVTHSRPINPAMLLYSDHYNDMKESNLAPARNPCMTTEMQA